MTAAVVLFTVVAISSHISEVKSDPIAQLPVLGTVIQPTITDDIIIGTFCVETNCYRRLNLKLN